MTTQKLTLGWREWIALPELGIPCIKAKVDTGARTSCLHAFSVDEFSENGIARVRFCVHPLQRRSDIALSCVADIIDRRWVSDSGGHKEQRIVINTSVALGTQRWAAEFTLTNRDSMRFRVLLGRSAISGRYLVDSERAFEQSGRYPVGVEDYFK